MEGTLELPRIDKWLDDVLSTDITLIGLVQDKIFARKAPVKTKPPMIVYQRQTSRDVRSIRHRIMTNNLYLVRAIVEGSSTEPAIAIADRIDVLLTNGNQQNVGGVDIMWCVREEPFDMLDVDNGVQYMHLGGMYRIWAQKTNP